MRTESKRYARHFLQDFVKCLLSTVASRLLIGQGFSCFCAVIVVGGDNVAHFQLFNKLLDEFLEKRWTKRSKVEACRAEC